MYTKTNHLFIFTVTSQLIVFLIKVDYLVSYLVLSLVYIHQLRIMICLIFLPLFFFSYNCELYKKVEASSSVWNSHVFKSVNHAKTKVECGSLCKAESSCHGFRHDETCYLIDMENTNDIVTDQSGEDIYLSVSKHSNYDKQKS